MWSGVQWSLCVAGLALTTITVTSLAIFLAFYKKHADQLCQRILNMLYAKLVVLSIVDAIVMFTQICMNLSKFGITVKMVIQIFLYIRLFIHSILLEISLFSLLRVFSSQLYMWASLNIHHTANNVIHALLMVFIQYLININAGIVSADTPVDIGNKLGPSATVFVVPILATVFILQMIILLR